MTALSAVLQVAGLAVVALGLGLVYPPLGVVAAGASAFVLGIVLALPRRAT